MPKPIEWFKLDPAISEYAAEYGAYVNGTALLQLPLRYSRCYSVVSNEPVGAPHWTIDIVVVGHMSTCANEPFTHPETGHTNRGVSLEDARAVAAAFAQEYGSIGAARRIPRREFDSWRVAGSSHEGSAPR